MEATEIDKMKSWPLCIKRESINGDCLYSIGLGDKDICCNKNRKNDDDPCIGQRVSRVKRGLCPRAVFT